MFTRSQRVLRALALIATGGVAAGFCPGPAGGGAPAEPTWSPAVTLSAPGWYLHPSDVAVAPDGSMAVVFLHGGDLKLVQRAPGGAWGAPIALTSDGLTTSAQAAYDGSGLLYVAWSRTSANGRQTQLRAQHTLAEGGWSHTQVVQRRAVGSLTGIQLSVNRNGAQVLGAQWLGSGETAFQRLLVSLRPRVGAWQPPRRWDGITGFEVALGDGGQVAVSLTHGTENQTIRVARGPVVGGWGSTALVSRIPHAGPFHTEIADLGVDREGTVTVAWRQRSADGSWRPRAARARAGEAFAPAVTLADPVGFSDFPVHLVANADGAVLVTWSRANGAVQAVRRPVGGPWGDPETIAPRASGLELVSLDAAMDPSGAALVIWSHGPTGGEGKGLSARALSSSGAWGSIGVLAPDTVLVNRAAPLAAMNGGAGLVVWGQSSGSSGFRITVRTRP